MPPRSLFVGRKESVETTAPVRIYLSVVGQTESSVP